MNNLDKHNMASYKIVEIGAMYHLYEKYEHNFRFLMSCLTLEETMLRARALARKEKTIYLNEDAEEI